MKNLTSKLKTPCIIQKQVEIPDEAGGFDTNWSDYKTIFVQISDVRDYQNQIGGKANSSLLYKITSRWIDDLAKDNRLKINNKTFNIKAIINISEESKIMEIIAEEII